MVLSPLDEAPLPTISSISLSRSFIVFNLFDPAVFAQ